MTITPCRRNGGMVHSVRNGCLEKKKFLLLCKSYLHSCINTTQTLVVDEFKKKRCWNGKGEQNQTGAHQHPHFTHSFSRDLSESLPAHIIYGVGRWRGGNPLRTPQKWLACARSHTHTPERLISFRPGWKKAHHIIRQRSAPEMHSNSVPFHPIDTT